jgi:hypothetical protein
MPATNVHGPARGVSDATPPIAATASNAASMGARAESIDLLAQASIGQLRLFYAILPSVNVANRIHSA